MAKKRTIYKTQEGKAEIFALYDSQLSRLPLKYSDMWVYTSFGKTHLIETGNVSGVPLLFFHGGNATTAYNLISSDFLFEDFHIYAVDTIGHPGKSDETCLSANNYDYGKWASEVISGLGFENICCFGGSFGAGIIAKTMCVAPTKVSKAVLYNPSGIKNAPAINSMSMMVPMIRYWVTHKEEWLKKCMLPMAVTEDNITKDIYDTAKCSIDYAKIKTGMPSNVKSTDMRKCDAPTLVMASEKDCLFPAKMVIPQAENIIPNCTTYLLEGRGHMCALTEEEKWMIIEFLL
ncbi:alpha/beta fold hydrolase [Anaerosporobacter sp.]|uniref:alpha/beta fold hydrolase n=1 Tax=Anaerosporobacter sp. TaxID=1872529 RepID=UPI00286F322D|nr:alpha/beta hydrolase [Anaerosporobacter sp.]